MSKKCSTAEMWRPSHHVAVSEKETPSNHALKSRTNALVSVCSANAVLPEYLPTMGVLWDAVFCGFPWSSLSRSPASWRCTPPISEHSPQVQPVVRPSFSRKEGRLVLGLVIVSTTQLVYIQSCHEWTVFADFRRMRVLRKCLLGQPIRLPTVLLV